LKREGAGERIRVKRPACGRRYGCLRRAAWR
jgi:hypothetical protein